MKKRTRLFATMTAIVVLLLLLLTGCTSKRILTDLSEEDFIAYVSLQDGYLHFTNADLFEGTHLISAVGSEMEMSYEEVVEDLRVDPVEMSKTLPEKYHLTEESLGRILKSDLPTYDIPYGGYEFIRKGDPGEHYIAETVRAKPEFRIILKRMHGGERENCLFHDSWTAFDVFPWELTGRGFNPNRLSDDEIYHSEVNGQEVGVTHRIIRLQYFFPDVEWDYFYGGFYAGDLAVCVESDYSYCTQAEFIEVFLAIFDYITALEA